MDPLKLRQDFPVLAGDDPPVYLDNACMPMKPEPVLQAMDDYYRNFPTCGGRSLHRLAFDVTERYETARGQLQRFIGAADASEIVFTRNTTEAINIVAWGLDLQPGDTVLTSDREHNSNVVPWHALSQRTGVLYSVIPSRDDFYFDLEALKEALTPNTKLVSVVHTSNLDGYTLPARDITEICHDAGVLVMLDAAQSAAHTELDAQALDVDFLAASAHKFCGPSGTGLLYGKAEALAQLKPTFVGGSTVRNSTYNDCQFLPPPSCFEAGLQNYAGMIGACAAADYVAGVGRDKIHAHEVALNARLTQRLESIDGLSLLGPPESVDRGGIFSFNLAGLDSHEIAMNLDETANIAIRSGMHCVHSWFNSRGINGSARASFYMYNTPAEADCFADALEETQRTLSGSTTALDREKQSFA